MEWARCPLDTSQGDEVVGRMTAVEQSRPGHAGQLERQLHERQQMMDAVLSNSSDMVVVITSELRFGFVSEAVRRILGRQPADLVGHDVFELLHPDDVGTVAEALTRSVETGPGVKEPIVLRIRHADGSWRQIEIIVNNLTDVDPVGGLLVTGRDLSERLRAEATAAAARDRFEQAFDRAPIGMALVSNEGRLLRANGALAVMCGTDVAALTGSNLFELVHPEDRDEALTRARAVLEHDDPMPIEVRFRGRGGQVAWARVTSTVIRDDLGVPMHTITHLEDVTDQRLLREQLERAAAHDPLTGLLNRAGFATRFAQLGEERAGGPGALMLIDLDGFKAVNDAHGHAAGDRLLELVADRLAACVRSTDLVGRLGGDEFAVYQPDVADAAMVLTLGERVRIALAQPYTLPEGPARLSGSIGVALLDGDVRLERALAAADGASYAAKRNGGDAVELTWCTALAHNEPLTSG